MSVVSNNYERDSLETSKDTGFGHRSIRINRPEENVLID